MASSGSRGREEGGRQGRAGQSQVATQDFLRLANWAAARPRQQHNEPKTLH